MGPAAAAIVVCSTKKLNNYLPTVVVSATLGQRNVVKKSSTVRTASISFPVACCCGRFSQISITITFIFKDL